MYRLIATLLLSGAFIAPVAMKAGDNRPVVDDHRYYDREARDYHQWTEAEDRAYRQYLTERHRSYREFKRLNAQEKRDYWNWRHHNDGYRH